MSKLYRVEFDRNMGNFHDLTYFPLWMEGTFLNTGYFDEISLIYKIKTCSYQ